MLSRKFNYIQPYLQSGTLSLVRSLSDHSHSLVLEVVRSHSYLDLEYESSSIKSTERGKWMTVLDPEDRLTPVRQTVLLRYVQDICLM